MYEVLQQPMLFLTGVAGLYLFVLLCGTALVAWTHGEDEAATFALLKMTDIRGMVDVLRGVAGKN